MIFIMFHNFIWALPQKEVGLFVSSPRFANFNWQTCGLSTTIPNAVSAKVGLQFFTCASLQNLSQFFTHNIGANRCENHNTNGTQRH